MSTARSSSHRNADASRDVITDNYRAILTELGLLTTVSVLLFGFLLSRARQGHSETETWLLFVALLAVASATAIFLLPVAYHRLQYPYEDWEKFQIRSHWFVTAGLVPFGLGFYASVALAVWDRTGMASFAVAGGPLAVALVLFGLRRIVPD